MCADMGQLTERDVNAYSPLALAFLGDSVYERLVRERVLRTANMPALKLHNLTVARVCAVYQSAAVEAILPLLTEQEAAILKRGRNATGNTAPKHTDLITYRRATGLECLFGYLQLLERYARMEELFTVIWEQVQPDKE